MTGRFKKIDGLNYKQGAIDYPTKLAPSDRYHLYTKPFYNLANKIARWSGQGLDEDTQRHFCDFANIAYALALPAGSRILDVGCGSGWLSEYFARFGYRVTGIDISPELIRIARDRLQSLPYSVDHETEITCDFLVHDIEAAPLDQFFDAVICYDALHHFENEHAVLNNISRMLRDGALLFVAEGERPPDGAETEEELRQVMEKYETLEAPFTREYLLELLKQHGFAITGDYTAGPGLVERDNLEGNTLKFIETPGFNYLLCRSTNDPNIRDSRSPGSLLADLTILSDWKQGVERNAQLEFDLKITNAGDTLLLVSREPLPGRVRIGLKIISCSSYEVVDEVHGWPRLQRAMAPGDETTLRVTLKAQWAPGSYLLKIDLLDQDICWFEQHGSKPLALDFEVI
jgi:2-polyprenyl-3-methyl-5-hydroxy-6-metoxy-1,4-benzoquinol methylase